MRLSDDLAISKSMLFDMFYKHFLCLETLRGSGPRCKNISKMHDFELLMNFVAMLNFSLVVKHNEFQSFYDLADMHCALPFLRGHWCVR